MNKLKKKILRSLVACGLLSALLVTTCFAAATWSPWGPQYFTPYTGKMGVYSDSFQVKDLKWSENQIEQIQNAGGVGYKSIELECRPYNYNATTGTATIENSNNLWVNDGEFVLFTNFPDSYSYAEFQSDDNDIAIAMTRLANVEAEKAYHGTFELEPLSGVSFSNRPVLLESEFGRYVTYDSVPTNYEQLFNYTSDSNVLAADTWFGILYAW